MSSIFGLKKQPFAWSLTNPIACMKAKTVVGPTNFQPRFFKSFDKATDVGDVDIVCGVAISVGSGSNRQK